VILALLVWLVLTGLIGYAAVGVIWPGPSHWKSGEAVLRAALVVGLGFGLSSSALFVAIAVFGPGRLVAPGTDILVLLLLALGARARARTLPGDRERFPAPPAGLLDRAIAWGMLALLGVALIATLAFTFAAPHGQWDAWGIYNLTARYIYLGGASWRRAFSAGLGIHPDYPLLLPGSVVRGWLYAGRATDLVPQITGILFAYAAAGLVVGAVWVFRGRRHAGLTSVVLLGTPVFLSTAAAQYADLPLSFYFVAAIVLYGLANRLPDESTWLYVGSGLCAGLAAWTKNEGLLYILIVAFGLLVIHRQLLRDRDDKRAIAAFVAGLVPVLAMIAYFKLTLAPPNDLVSGQGSGTLPRILDASRYVLILRSAMRVAPAFPVIPVVIFLAVVGLDRDAGDRKATLLAIFALIALAAGYFAVYVVTPLDLSIQLHRSLDRLMMQLWPLLVLIVFMVARVPEQAPADAPT
jgi:hypothetical protein